MDLGLRGKVAIITGASRGIGEAIARRLGEEGCRLALFARNKERLEQSARQIAGSDSGGILTIPCDVTSAEQVAQAMAGTLERFGTIHILVNNAGGAETMLPFDALTDEQWRRTWELNVLSAVRMTRAALPAMRAQRWGRVINISSESAIQPDPIFPDYNSAKAALTNLSKSLSKAYAAEGILVNTVSPAFVMTPLLREFIQRNADASGLSFAEAEAGMLKSFRPHIEVKRPGAPEETASMVAFLASELASFVNGADVRVDGGSVASI